MRLAPDPQTAEVVAQTERAIKLWKSAGLITGGCIVEVTAQDGVVCAQVRVDLTEWGQAFVAGIDLNLIHSRN